MREAEDTKVELTGNPFVDTGLAVIAARAGLFDVRDLTLSDLHKVHGDGRQLACWNSRFKSFTMIFTSNSMLSNPSVKDSVKRTRDYLNVLRFLLENVGSGQSPFRCEACGASRAVDFDSLCRHALAETDATVRSRSIGRDWFPLIGSVGSDAQALPSASRPLRLCATCLFAVQYLPLGVMLLDGRLALFQSPHTEMWYELVKDITADAESRVSGGNYDTMGAKEGSRAMIGRLLGLFERLQIQARFSSVPNWATLLVWRFSNAGASAECEVEEIPNSALRFLWEAARRGFRGEVETLAKDERKREFSFLRCVTQKRDFLGLYPRGKRRGASPELFALYQTTVCGRSPRALETARFLGNHVVETLGPKHLSRLRREEAFLEPWARNHIRGAMAALVQKERFTLNDYLGLFRPRNGNSGAVIQSEGWNLVRYFLHHPSESTPLAFHSQPAAPEAITGSKVHYYADQIFRRRVEVYGRGRFDTDVLAQLRRGHLRLAWLRREFCVLAEVDQGFTYSAWEALCKDDYGRPFVSEVLFQMRLLWTEWMVRSELPMAPVPDAASDSGLPCRVESCLREAFGRYVERWGLPRFRRDILGALCRKELGLPWFRQQLLDNEHKTKCACLSEREWGHLLTDEEGRSMHDERLFQMHLLLANLYRVSQ